MLYSYQQGAARPHVDDQDEGQPSAQRPQKYGLPQRLAHLPRPADAACLHAAMEADNKRAQEDGVYEDGSVDTDLRIRQSQHATLSRKFVKVGAALVGHAVATNARCLRRS